MSRKFPITDDWGPVPPFAYRARDRVYAKTAAEMLNISVSALRNIAGPGEKIKNPRHSGYAYLYERNKILSLIHDKRAIVARARRDGDSWERWTRFLIEQKFIRGKRARALLMALSLPDAPINPDYVEDALRAGRRKPK